jgi:hemoglobin
LEITEQQLADVIAAFYARVRRDPDLGPIFNGAVGDWDEHLQTLASFWSSVMLTTGRYKGNPLAVHRKHVEAISPALFDRWLALWRETISELLTASAAAALQVKAERIAESLKLGLFYRLEPARKTAPPIPIDPDPRRKNNAPGQGRAGPGGEVAFKGASDTKRSGLARMSRPFAASSMASR